MKTQVDDGRRNTSDQHPTGRSERLAFKRRILQGVLQCPQCHGDLKDEEKNVTAGRLSVYPCAH